MIPGGLLLTPVRAVGGWYLPTSWFDSNHVNSCDQRPSYRPNSASTSTCGSGPCFFTFSPCYTVVGSMNFPWVAIAGSPRPIPTRAGYADQRRILQKSPPALPRRCLLAGVVLKCHNNRPPAVYLKCRSTPNGRLAFFFSREIGRTVLYRKTAPTTWTTESAALRCCSFQYRVMWSTHTQSLTWRRFAATTLQRYTPQVSLVLFDLTSANRSAKFKNVFAFIAQASV